MKDLIMSTIPKKSTILIRFMVGFYFLAGGILKLYMPGLQDTGFFQGVAFASAGNIALTISIFEALCGFLIVVGLFTKVAVIPLILTIGITFFAGKLPIMAEEGFFLMAHLSRIDFTMALGCIYLLINGSGILSLDYKMSNQSLMSDSFDK